jgi:hypothetical protein
MAREAQLVALLLNPLLNHEPSPPSTPSPQATRERLGYFQRKGSARALETQTNMPIPPHSERDCVKSLRSSYTGLYTQSGAERGAPALLSCHQPYL